MTQKTFYITTPIYYVNAKPHIGHAYTSILCDCFSRYHRLLGEKVFYLTGTDEHGTKVEKAAREQNKEPQQYVDEVVQQFQNLWAMLDIRYDQFIRTTQAEHKKVVQNILRDLEARGEIYKASYQGWYCTPCESFWTQLQLVDGKCPDCHRDVQELSEENYFFKLSNHQTWLIEYIRTHPAFILPEIRRNEILGFLREPLEDLCITRPKTRLRWGIDYPGSAEHVVYVWFDALINYVSAIGLTVDEKRFSSVWPASVQVIGKDILRQHAVYWPIMLKAIGVDMPETVLAHGWWTIAGAKVSKSRGNIVDSVEIVKKYGVDAFRYFLLHEVTLGLDGAYSEDLLRERYTSDLANDLGNLWFRLASMLEKYFGSAIPNSADGSAADPLTVMTYELWAKVQACMMRYDPRGALDALWQVVTRANQYVEEKKPWVLAKDPSKKEELALTLWILSECIAHLAYLLTSFLPETAGKILTRMGLPIDAKMETEADFKKRLVRTGSKVQRGDALFPKLDDEE
ncbi:MAG: methionine--tRNA ligase [Candidatus Omnitrophica bacterium]|nr:methionine--tRNA ligase [Candidatus Omnitrophota bacterium]